MAMSRKKRYEKRNKELKQKKKKLKRIKQKENRITDKIYENEIYELNTESMANMIDRYPNDEDVTKKLIEKVIQYHDHRLKPEHRHHVVLFNSDKKLDIKTTYGTTLLEWDKSLTEQIFISLTNEDKLVLHSANFELLDVSKNPHLKKWIRYKIEDYENRLDRLRRRLNPLQYNYA